MTWMIHGMYAMRTIDVQTSCEVRRQNNIDQRESEQQFQIPPFPSERPSITMTETPPASATTATATATETTGLIASPVGGLSSSSPSSVSSNQPTGLWLSRTISQWLERHIPGFGQFGNLQESFDYFEHYILPRKLVSSWKKAPPGTKEATTLYPGFCTPQYALRDFGTGLAVYFETLRYLCVICFLAYILYLPSIWYYQSTDYDPGNDEKTMDRFLLGSLMCRDTKWVPCLDCHGDAAERLLPGDRLATSSNNDNINSDITFILKNDCAAIQLYQGLNHLLVLLFLVISMIYLGFYQQKLEQQYDEDVLTAQDYSLVVLNPPPYAIDANVWKTFFEQFGKVVYCTVALDNEELVATLVQRRAVLLQASFQIISNDKNDDNNNDSNVFAASQNEDEPLNSIPAFIQERFPKLHQKHQSVEKKCREMLLEQSYDATRVFCIFDTEAAQRLALQKLTVSHLTLATNDNQNIPPQHLFNGKYILHVREPVEPSVVRWPDLNETLKVRIAQRLLSGTITVLLIYAGFVSVKAAFTLSVTFAAYLIAILNIAVPNLFKFVNRLESHAGESSYQASLFAKASVFRYVCVCCCVVTPD